MKILKAALAMIILSYSNHLFAESCEIMIEGNDVLQFNLSEIVFNANCPEVTINLKHTGQLAANIMGHNWVLTRSNDFMAVAQAGGVAGPASNYVPLGDPRVIAASSMIGGGEETSVTFSTESLDSDGDYTFFCSFPGHYAIMQGSFKISD